MDSSLFHFFVGHGQQSWLILNIKVFLLMLLHLSFKKKKKNFMQVELVPYDADTLDTTVLWTTSKDLGDGFRGIRTVKNIRLHLDAFHGDQRSGGVRDGTTIVLWDWNKGDNQRWKIIPCCKSKKHESFL